MRKTLLVAAAALLAFPAFASHWGPLTYTREAHEELTELRSALRYVRDPVVRGDLLQRVDRVDSLVSSAEGEFREGPPAPQISFGDARTMVLRETFDDDKLAVISRLANQTRFTTTEAMALADLCTFETNKADALVALYPAVSDPQRFGLALDILTFSSTRREVESALDL